MTQTHRPIPTLAPKECGVEASRDGQVAEDGPGAGGPCTRDGSAPGLSGQVACLSNHRAQFAQTGIVLCVQQRFISTWAGLLFFYNWYFPHFLTSFLLHTTHKKLWKDHLSPTMKMSKKQKTKTKNTPKNSHQITINILKIS